MSRARTLILLGIVVALTPFIGLPLYVLAWVLPILGLMIALTGYSLRTRRVSPEERPVEPPAAAPAFDIHEPSQTQ